MKRILATIAGWLRLLANWLSPATDLGAQIELLFSDPAYQPILRAIHKTNADRVMGAEVAEVKLAETLTWAEHYSSKKVARRDAWKTRFLIELLIGLEKGKLRR